MLPHHLKQIRVLMLNDKENLERTLFRLEQGDAFFKQAHFQCYTVLNAWIYQVGCSNFANYLVKYSLFSSFKGQRPMTLIIYKKWKHGCARFSETLISICRSTLNRLTHYIHYRTQERHMPHTTKDSRHKLDIIECNKVYPITTFLQWPNY